MRKGIMDIPNVLLQRINNENIINQTANILNCNRQQNDLTFFYHMSLGPAILIILILAALEKRKQSCLHLWNGRFGIPIPVNLLDEFEHRWSYSIAFGAITNTVVDILVGDQYLDQDLSPIALAFLGVFSIFEASINFYPFFACLFTTHRLVGSVIGFFYGSMWMAMKIYLISLCPDPDPDTLPYATLFQQIPTTMCLAFLVGKFGRETVESLYHKRYINTLDTTLVAYPEQMAYVRELLQKPPSVVSRKDEESWSAWLAALYKKHMYDSRSHFMASTRMISTLFVVANVSYQVMILSIQLSGAFRLYVTNSIRTIFNSSAVVDVIGEGGSVEENLKISLRMFEVSWWITAVIAAGLYLVSIFGILGNYRRQSIMLYKGDKSFIPYKYSPASAEILANGQKFSGYQIAYFIWGIAVVNVVVLLLLLVFCFIIILPPLNDRYDILEYILFVSGVPGLVSVSVILITSIASKQAFLQDKLAKKDKDKPLALNNRKWYHVNAYFLFLFTVATGFFASLFRILQGGFFGIIYLGRCDQCVLMPGFESLDRGYSSYIGMLLVECTHNHPVLRVFCQILLRNKPDGRISDAEKGDLNQPGKDSVLRRKKRVKIRWLTLYTLVRNPSLVLYRKNEFESITSDSVQKDLANYRLYAHTKTKLEELERKIFRENVYEGLFSRVRTQSKISSTNSNGTVEKSTGKRFQCSRKNKVNGNVINVRTSEDQNPVRGTLDESAAAPPTVEGPVVADRTLKLSSSDSDEVESSYL